MKGIGKVTNPREGEVLETWDNVFFDVKGLTHPPDRVVAFIRFFPSVDGDRLRDGRRYRKVYSLKDRYTILESRFPQYLVYDPVFDEYLCEVPYSDIKFLHDPVNFLREIRLRKRRPDNLTLKALKFAELLKENSNIPWSSIGISGSVMIGMHKQSSDIDILIYGSRNCLSVYENLKTLLKDEGPVKPYGEEGLRKLFLFRYKDTHMSYEDFKRVESRKVTQGIFEDRDFFIRFVKNFEENDERYGEFTYRKAGWAKVKARIIDSSDSIFTPCRYRIDDVEILSGKKVNPIVEISSFRGRFCDQAREGEEIIAQGKLERAKESGDSQHYYRLLLGDAPSDYMILADG